MRFLLNFALLFAGISGFSSAALASETGVATSQRIERDRFTVETIGAGPDVILIPGLASPRDSWAPTIAQLKDRYRLHLVQIRGFGDDAAINASGPVLEGFVEGLAGYIRDAQLKQPAIIGHSMGGLTAAMIAARHPELPGRVLIEDSLPFIGLIFSPMATVDAVRPQADVLRKAALAAGQQPADARTLSTMSATAAGRAQVLEWGKSADFRVAAQLFYDVLTTDIRPELGKIAAPVTMVYPYDLVVGPQPMVDALYANAYAQVRGVTLIRIEGSRHFIRLDQPEKFSAVVEAFLAGYGAASAAAAQ